MHYAGLYNLSAPSTPSSTTSSAVPSRRTSAKSLSLTTVAEEAAPVEKKPRSTIKKVFDALRPTEPVSGRTTLIWNGTVGQFEQVPAQAGRRVSAGSSGSGSEAGQGKRVEKGRTTLIWNEKMGEFEQVPAQAGRRVFVR